MPFPSPWPDRFGRTFNFEAHPIGTEFLRVPGVYVVFRLLANGNRLPLYVGEAEDLNDRLNVNRRAHAGLQRAISRGATHISALRLAGRNARLAVETELRHSLRPACNLQGR